MFGTESIGDLPTRHIAVLLYLASTKRKKRFESPQKVADALGLGSENTVALAYKALYNRGYVTLAKDAPKTNEPPGRDATVLEVTSSGKRALRPFFNVVGMSGLVTFVVLSLVIGSFLGDLYALAPLYYPQYAAAIIGSFVLIALVYAFTIQWLWRTARDNRRDQLFKMFRADTKSD